MGVRRTYYKAAKGQIYATEWIEWHLDCADPLCEEHTLAAELGSYSHLSKAEKETREQLNRRGWVKRKGLWYCPNHAKEIE